MTFFAILGAGILAITLIFILIHCFRFRVPDYSQYDQPHPPLIKPPEAISAQHHDVLATLEEYHKKPVLSTARARERMDELFSRPVESTTISVDANGVGGEWVIAEGADPNKRLLYIHGGAFRVGSTKSHRFIASEFSRLAGVSVLSIDYRMQPEFKTIHCHEDCRIAYEWILENGPEGKSAPEHLFVAGDSAGGNLTLALLAWARDNRKRAADGAVAIAPATDISMSCPSWKTNADSDPFLGPVLGKAVKTPSMLLRPVLSKAAGKPVNHSEVSPLFGDLSNLPPILIQVSCDEMLYDDGVRYANKAISQGSDVTLQVWPSMVHVFQGFAPDLPEANDAFQLIKTFIRQHIEK
ncbi:MAG: alpha/beta hydrolase [Pseudohongiellaceae bacterium]